MAEMWPRRIRPDTASAAERRLFDVLRRDLGDGWSVAHSLGLTGHDRKPWAEIDFVLIGPPGVFCLEVKGGRIRREDGVWIFTDRAGVEYRRADGPFEQVGPASSALHRHLVDRNPRLRDAVVGYAIATPDVEFRVTGPDIDRELVYDVSDTVRPFSAFVQRMVERWEERVGRREPLTRAQTQAVVDLIRGDFDLQPSLPALIGEAERELVRLTEQQARTVRGLSSNERVLVSGGAGTGKTYLAAAEAKRLVDLGKRVLLTCLSERLAKRLRRMAPEDGRLSVIDFHSLVGGVVREHDAEHRLPKAAEEDLRGVFRPELAVELLLEEGKVRYDAVVVDEAQDLLTPQTLEVVDALLAGGLAKGTWRIFYDGNQNVFAGTAPAALRSLRALSSTEFHLDTNCRNTHPIGTNTAMLACVPPEDVLTVEGPEVELYWYRDAPDQRRQLARLLGRLLGSGVSPGDIVVLSRFEFDRSAVRGGELPGVSARIREYDGEDDGGIRFSTIRDFKGLESPVVVVVDVAALGESATCSLLYVALSRAEVVLSVFVPEEERGRYEELARTFGERFAFAESAQVAE